MMTTGAYNASSNTTMVIEGGTAVLFTFVANTINAMIPYLVVAFIIIDVDLYFGIEAAKHRKEKVRFSSAARRTISKMFEYICWVILSATLSTAFEATWLQYVVLGVVMGNELSSIVSNYFEAHGKRIKGFNIFKILSEKSGLDLNNVTIDEDKNDSKAK